LSVYPNPVQNSRVIIEDGTLKNGKVYYSVYSSSGIKVLTGEYLVEANHLIELDLDKSLLKPGVYFLILIGNNYNAPKKIRLIVE
ncbi:MAG: T9SS type A sorting domain-containing protein, partial [Cyclobacteriaceae bacterium]|nr:T9SS type A sorting domain-containing protein [Cyclobacteriaceae bacterium]